MTDVLLDARLAIRGLGIGTYVDRLVGGFAGRGDAPRVWKGSGEWGRAGVVSTLAHSGLFDISPRLDPRTARFDVVHFASNLGALRPGSNSVVTVHDLMHRRSRRPRDRLAGAVLERSLTRAGRVVAVSDRTRIDLEAHFPPLAGKVEVITHGMRRLPRAGGDREHIVAFGGASDPRKRTDLMVAVYRAYRDTTPGALPLVVLARSGVSDAQRRELAEAGARLVPSATADEVDALMRGAAALIYPTVEEGFGLPILEAAEACTPVVMDAAAAVASEVVGRHCHLVGGTSVEDWVRELRRAVATAPVEHDLDLPTWPAVAERYRCLYADVARA